eukprot:CAMPEP_0201583046 /NCGR_PEP_ID=MMETSP0190_2-20130828/93683_1 /ASSEMBLY_ACC=CAM_ASM_000263 /TAXON_ID=37353 /ORGANISM="Rosalina sp." /LENGTH=393 /DNA_ID=CAMNT_0048024209 /DNA_START=82 /DNA_END=1264 /DNA_ORIENTATION=-
MTILKDMTQDQLIQWIQLIPTDESFTASVQQEIIAGIKKYAAEAKSAVSGLDFFDAEDWEDVQEFTKVDKKKSKALFRKIGSKKQQDYNDNQPGAARQDSSAPVFKFKLNIQGMKGQMYSLDNIDKSWTIAAVKKLFLEELGDTAAADQYNSNHLYKWKQTGKKIELKHGGQQMKDGQTLQSYGITNGLHLPLILTFKVQGGAEAKYNSLEDEEDKYRTRKIRRKKHKGLIKLSATPDCIMGYCDADGIPRAEMPCGCSFAADTMYRYMKSLFEKDFKEVKPICPMPKTQCKGNDNQRRWPWGLVFAIADLSQKEIAKYNKAIENRLSGSKNCPHCDAVTERPKDLRISRVDVPYVHHLKVIGAGIVKENGNQEDWDLFVVIMIVWQQRLMKY